MRRIDKLIAELCPDGVQSVRLGELTFESSVRNAQQLISEVRSVTNSQGLVRTSDFFENTRTSTNTNAYKVVQPGMFVYNPSRVNVGSISWLNESEPVIVSPMYVVFGIDYSRILPDYLMLFLGSSVGKSKIENKTEIGARFRLRYASLADIAIPLPPLEVQHEIVWTLDQFTQLEAELKAELDARRHQYEHYRRELLSFESGTEWVTLSDVADYMNGKAHERLANPDGSVPMVTARFISRNGEANRFVRLEDVRTPANAGDTALVLSDLPNGRALARTFFIDRDNSYAINQRVARLRVKDVNQVAPRFLYYVLNRNPGLLKYDNGADQTHLSKGQVTGLRFPVPPVSEQLRIVGVLDAFNSLVNDLSVGLPAELAARRKQYEYYRDRLLNFVEAKV